MGAIGCRVQTNLGLVLLGISFLVSKAHANVQSKVRCSEQSMEVDIARTTPQALIYLQQLKNYPDEACKPKLTNGIATFTLSLLEKDLSRCGVMRVTNKLTGQKMYYHRIIIEEPQGQAATVAAAAAATAATAAEGYGSKHTITAKCSITEVVVQQPNAVVATNHTVFTRSVLPEDFEADANTQVAGGVVQTAATPIVLFNVRQGNKIIKDELVVKPGTPLQMEIYLDEEAAKVYGILVTHMQVTDTHSQEETIIYNGCSVDPYLFENFETVNGHYLSAKFRAFKFPESSYVQFHGTVSVCVGKCRGIECSNGRIGYGRKRRSVEAQHDVKNEIYETAVVIFMKVESDDLTDEGKTRERLVRAEDAGDHFKYNTIAAVSDASTSSSSIFVCIIFAFLCIDRIL
ncbi:uncharacterized protein LOC131673028 isoform X2 [Phymastichus coffea]|uniref:uncharacterized protein LOC131673028 isoform X2 n=1 Tax=Phymastichus coffea TaxID=108790 RepID=UPI00273CA4ED|nr:uncharacterized protein LOC131673028 isoform X2 [Phymastichus coffea]